MSKIIHYRDKCIGCGICYEMQPQEWRMSKRDGKVTLLHATIKKNIYLKDIPALSVELSKQVSAACPTRCIQVN